MGQPYKESWMESSLTRYSILKPLLDQSLSRDLLRSTIPFQRGGGGWLKIAGYFKGGVVVIELAERKGLCTIVTHKRVIPFFVFLRINYAYNYDISVTVSLKIKQTIWWYDEL